MSCLLINFLHIILDLSINNRKDKNYYLIYPTAGLISDNVFQTKFINFVAQFNQ